MNNFTIFQTKEETQLAIAVHQNAQINNVRLARAKVISDRPEDSIKDIVSVSMGVKAKHIDGPSGQLLVEVSFRLAGAKKGNSAKSKPPFCVECTFEVSYVLRSEFTPTAEQAKAFKDGNAIFNCWPYCRQYVQETIQRIGYPPLTLPFLRVQTKHREKKALPKPD
jgi:hypothetical protein